jgi:tetratricopeptide (TPR) repeat protein
MSLPRFVLAFFAAALCGCARAPSAAHDGAASPPMQDMETFEQQEQREAMSGIRYESGRALIDEAEARAIAPREDPTRAEAEFQRGLVLVQQNQNTDAIGAHTKAVLLDRRNPRMYEGLGLAFLSKRMCPEAAAAFRSGLDLDPESVALRFDLGDTLIRLNQREAGIAELRQVIQRDPGHTRAHERLAIQLYYTADFAGAWREVHATEALGASVPPQFRVLLAARLAGRAALSLPIAQATSGQVSVGAQVRVDAGAGTARSNETSMSAAASNPLEIFGAWNDYREAGFIRVGVGLSLDGGASWSDFQLRPPGPNRAAVEGDPMTCYDDRSGALWVGGISFTSNGGIFVARKDAGAAAFQSPVMARVSGGADKGWMAAGADPFNPHATRVYIAYNEGVLRSTDMGNSWSGPVPLASGIGFLPRVGPGGVLYVVYWNFGFAHQIQRSFDGGASFGSPITVATRMDAWGLDGSRVPGDYRVAILQAFAVDPNDGTLYVVYFDTTSIAANGANVDLYFTKSTDQGLHWTTPVVINQDANPPGDQFFPWLEVDRSSRLHLVFYDTRNVVQNDSDPFGIIDAYYSYSDDHGASWTEIRLTNPGWSSAFDGYGGTFIGDYLGLSTAGHRTTPLYMSTQNGDADIFTHVVSDGPATTYCYGIRCPCGNDDPLRGCGNLGADLDKASGALLSASGTDLVANDDLIFTVSGLKPGALGVLYTGQARLDVPFADGRRCIGAWSRYPLRQASASGDLVYGPGEIVAWAASHWGAPVPGSTWHYQALYRDGGGPCGSGLNLSNAASVAWR